MKTIQILEDDDTIRMDDWCRPLELRPMSPQSDFYSFESAYGGTPENNVQWVRVYKIFGQCWYNKTIKEIYKEGTMRPYEFARGDIPAAHRLK